MKLQPIVSVLICSLFVVSIAAGQSDQPQPSTGEVKHVSYRWPGVHNPFMLWEDHCSCCTGCGVYGCDPSLWPVLVDGGRDIARALLPKHECANGCNGVCCSTAPVFSYRKRQKCREDLWSAYKQKHIAGNGIWSSYPRQPVVKRVLPKIFPAKHRRPTSTRDCTGGCQPETHAADPDTVLPPLDDQPPVHVEPLDNDEKKNPFEDDAIPTLPVAPTEDSSALRYWGPVRASISDNEEAQPAPVLLKQAASRTVVPIAAPKPLKATSASTSRSSVKSLKAPSLFRPGNASPLKSRSDRSDLR